MSNVSLYALLNFKRGRSPMIRRISHWRLQCLGGGGGQLSKPKVPRDTKSQRRLKWPRESRSSTKHGRKRVRKDPNNTVLLYSITLGIHNWISMLCGWCLPIYHIILYYGNGHIIRFWVINHAHLIAGWQKRIGHKKNQHKKVVRQSKTQYEQKEVSQSLFSRHHRMHKPYSAFWLTSLPKRQGAYMLILKWD